MPGPIGWFAEHQPFTPVMETLRGLLLGTGIGSDAVISIVWCAGVSLAGYVWSSHLYNRDPIR
jgi:ABC-2 type transport system permease protein